MSGYRKVLAGVGTLTLGLGLSLAGAVPTATASGTQDYCPADRVCLWFNSDYAGARADLRVSDANLSNELFNDGPVGANGWLVQVENNSASIRNRSGNGIYIYDLRNCDGNNGAYGYLAAGGAGNFTTALKNRVSSIVIDGGACFNVDQSNA
jgi:hypothetical protein